MEMKILSTEKKKHNARVVSSVLFGANENCSPRNSLSKCCSEEVEAEVSRGVILVKRDTSNQEQILQKLPLVTRSTFSVNDFSAF